ncbi:DUF3043 domain-containing protein [Gordonia soli]|uniref:DUF3043 domain-containing protein n=1 Tax=Gordonia soli NBRC 108243 TaxID=1223545 RepID=M0QLH2_9ACTN|nr:DUF3043 domain-containing protein [Gordonia soli]GAC69505.1 hypothetical protein GS4_25_00760 [Gordonia soli NBRC 108243]
MRLPWKKDEDTAVGDADATVTTEEAVDSAPAKGSAYTEGKGRPTPSRRDAEGRKRGPVAPPPTTRSEARARRKELRTSLSREDKQKLNAERRTQRQVQREKMMEGDERYLMPRDKGPVRRYARDLVDSRRNFAGLFMPFAIVLIVVMFLPAIAVYANIVLLVFVVFMAIDAVILGRLVNRRVRERYPDSADPGFRLGWYSFTRAMQLRKMRAPKPQVSAGDAV